MSSIRVVLGMATSLKLEIEQLDLKIAFFHDDLEEEVYMEQLEGLKFRVKKVCYATWKKVFMGSSRKLDNGTKILTPLWKLMGMVKLLLIIMYSWRNFIIMILFFSYFYVGDMLIVGHDK